MVPSQVPTFGVGLEPHGVDSVAAAGASKLRAQGKALLPSSGRQPEERGPGRCREGGLGGAEPRGCQDPPCAARGTAKGWTCLHF